MSACRLCFSLCRRCLCSGYGVAAGLPACRSGPDFVVISCRVASFFCERSGRQLSGYCPVCPAPVLSSPEHVPDAVVDDGALVQLSKPVVNGKGQGSAVDPELNVTIRVLPDLDVLPLKMSIFFIIFKQINLLIVL